MTTQSDPNRTRTCASCGEWCLWWTSLCGACRAIDMAAESFEKTLDDGALAVLVAFSEPAPRPLDEHVCDLDERSFIDGIGKTWIRIDVDCDACRVDGRMGLRVRRAFDHLRHLGPLIASAHLHGRSPKTWTPGVVEEGSERS